MDNGRTILDVGMENKYGKMDRFMKETGKMIWPMVKEDSSILVEMSMKETGSMIKLKEKEFICILMVQVIQVNGIRINNMDLDNRNGSMVLNTKETFLMD